MLELGMRLSWYCIDYRQGWKPDVHVCIFSYMNFDVIIDQIYKMKKGNTFFNKLYIQCLVCVHGIGPLLAV